jgi:hypothetical protein
LTKGTAPSVAAEIAEGIVIKAVIPVAHAPSAAPVDSADRVDKVVKAAPVLKDGVVASARE